MNRYLYITSHSTRISVSRYNQLVNPYQFTRSLSHLITGYHWHNSNSNTFESSLDYNISNTKFQPSNYSSIPNSKTFRRYISEKTRPSTPKLRIALIGLGAIGSQVAKAIKSGLLQNCELVAVLTKSSKKSLLNLKDSSLTSDRDSESSENNESILPPTVQLFSEEDGNVDDFFDNSNCHWDICVEAAGQQTVRDYAGRILDSDDSNRKLLLTSIGALTDDKLWKELGEKANSKISDTTVNTNSNGPGPRLLLVAGAMPALDWLSSACLDSLTDSDKSNSLSKMSTCTVTQIKPPKSWKGTPAEHSCPLENNNKQLHDLTSYTILFQGTAREAASKFPKNSNVACTLGLATIGLDRTIVKLATDPLKKDKGGCVVEFTTPGVRSIKVEVEETMSIENPRTSRIVPLSVIKVLRNMSERVVVGV